MHDRRRLVQSLRQSYFASAAGSRLIYVILFSRLSKAELAYAPLDPGNVWARAEANTRRRAPVRVNEHIDITCE